MRNPPKTKLERLDQLTVKWHGWRFSLSYLYHDGDGGPSIFVHGSHHCVRASIVECQASHRKRPQADHQQPCHIVMTVRKERAEAWGISSQVPRCEMEVAWRLPNVNQVESPATFEHFGNQPRQHDPCSSSRVAITNESAANCVVNLGRCY